MMLVLAILLPLVAAVGCYFLRVSAIRSLIVLGTGVVLAAVSLALLGQGSFTYSPGTIVGISWDSLITLADFALLFVECLLPARQTEVPTKQRPAQAEVGVMILELCHYRELLQLV